jgi:hypothetical protein
VSDAVRLKILPNHFSLIYTFFSVKSQKITKSQSTISVSIVFIEQPLYPDIIGRDVPISSPSLIQSILQKLKRSLFRHVSTFTQNFLLIFLR